MKKCTPWVCNGAECAPTGTMSSHPLTSTISSMLTLIPSLSIERNAAIAMRADTVGGAPAQKRRNCGPARRLQSVSNQNARRGSPGCRAGARTRLEAMRYSASPSDNERQVSIAISYPSQGRMPPTFHTFARLRRIMAINSATVSAARSAFWVRRASASLAMG
jgi:hypothetical protein